MSGVAEMLALGRASVNAVFGPVFGPALRPAVFTRGDAAGGVTVPYFFKGVTFDVKHFPPRIEASSWSFDLWRDTNH